MTISRMEQNSERWTSARHPAASPCQSTPTEPSSGQNSADQAKAFCFHLLSYSSERSLPATRLKSATSALFPQHARRLPLASQNPRGTFRWPTLATLWYSVKQQELARRFLSSACSQFPSQMGVGTPGLSNPHGTNVPLARLHRVRGQLHAQIHDVARSGDPDDGNSDDARLRKCRRRPDSG
jgi:hypothetical protein